MKSIKYMFNLSSSQDFYLYSESTDMRKSFDGLSGLILTINAQVPSNTSVFIFINKRRNKMKLLHWTGGGFVLYYKRLEEGSFELPDYDVQASLIVLNYAKIVMLIDGISILNIKKRKRY